MIIKKMKKLGILFLGMLFLSGQMICYAQEPDSGTEVPKELSSLHARSAVLMDGDSGRILFGKNEKEPLAMASTTKILTCILALELGDMEEKCRVSKLAASQPEVHLGMREGETYYLKDLLYSLMLESHNDTAVCVAEAIGGSVEEFTELMNEKALEIGCTTAYFVTPNGLDGKDEKGEHGIGAADLAKIMKYCVMESEQKELFLEITGTRNYTFQDAEGKRTFSCMNHNAMLSSLEGAVSGKTGFTNKAGYCYVGAARRGEETLIVALLACGWPGNRNYKWEDTRKLMEYGFEHYRIQNIHLEKLIFPAVRVLDGVETQVKIRMAVQQRNSKGSHLKVLIKEEERLRVNMNCPGGLEAPVKAGEQAGSLKVVLNGDILREYPLETANCVERSTFKYWVKRVLKSYLL